MQAQEGGESASTRAIFVRQLHGERKGRGRRGCLRGSNNINDQPLDPSQTGGSEEMGAVGGERPCKSDRAPWDNESKEGGELE